MASNISRELSINHRIKQISVVIGLMADKDVREVLLLNYDLLLIVGMLRDLMTHAQCR